MNFTGKQDAPLEKAFNTATLATNAVIASITMTHLDFGRVIGAIEFRIVHLLLTQVLPFHPSTISTNQRTYTPPPNYFINRYNVDLSNQMVE